MGAIGLEQLKKMERLLESRRRNAATVVERFAGDPRFIIQREHGESAWFGFIIILNPGPRLDRRSVLHALREAGIELDVITGGCFFDIRRSGSSTTTPWARS